MDSISRIISLFVFCLISGISPAISAYDDDRDHLLSRNDYLNRLDKTASLESKAQADSMSAIEAEICDPFPIPTEPQGPTITGELERYGDEFHFVTWRYPCDNEFSYVIFTIDPKTPEDRPFICSVQLTIIQDGLSDDTLKLVQDPVADFSDSWCGDIIQKTSFALIKRSISSDRLDLQKEFFVDWDLSTSIYQWDMFAYDPSDYGGSGSSFRINDELNDAWFEPATGGQGFFITVYPIRKSMFLAWFTYDVERPPQDVTAMLGEPGHRWLTAQGPYDGRIATLDVWVSEGGVFDSGQPKVSNHKDGTMTVTFDDCNKGRVSYDIPSVGLSGSVPIQRIVTDNVKECEAEFSGSDGATTMLTISPE